MAQGDRKSMCIVLRFKINYEIIYHVYVGIYHSLGKLDDNSP